MIPYLLPDQWAKFSMETIAPGFVEARSALLSLQRIPYQRRWVEILQELELKREIAGTSRIEGAEFTEQELDLALRENDEELRTRSQRQARAAKSTYRWISGIPHDHPITSDLIREIHRRIITGADDDHCEPGALRGAGENVHFGTPRHRGAEGGDECLNAFRIFCDALQGELRRQDPLIMALAAHYHLAAIHPFLDGNGRAARALEALLLQRAGLRDTCFIAMSNYYYEEKTGYLSALADVRAAGNDLTPFLKFGLKGVATQAGRLLDAIQHEISRELFRNLMYDLFRRLKSPRKRVIAERQIEVLKVLLESGPMEAESLIRSTAVHYSARKNPRKAAIRDITSLIKLRAVEAQRDGNERVIVSARLTWPEEITESEFFRWVDSLPKSKTSSFLS